MSGRVYAIATMDTKGAELAYVRQCLEAAGATVTTVDVGSAGPPTVAPDVPREHLRADAAELSAGDRGRAIAAMSQALIAFLRDEQAAGRVAGVIGLGGSGGTALITAALRALPIGLPKLMVSTVASGNTAPYVDCSDITMMYSVVDVAGLNVVSRRVLANAAHAMAGMVLQRPVDHESRPAIGMTMFGVTTPCVTRVREGLELRGFDGLVFHATGSGGRAMESLVDSGLIQGVLDITTTEVADEIVGGVFPSGPHRFEKLLERRVPLVLSLGALDMVNFGAIDTVPAQFRGRKLHVHNANVTLMRTNVNENRQIAAWIAGKLNRSSAPLRLLIPEGGVSLIDVPGQPFYDPEADVALFDELARRLHVTDERRMIRLPYAINAPEFSAALLKEYLELASVQLNLSKRTSPGRHVTTCRNELHMRHTRESVLAKLREKISRRQPIIGGGAGTGISAKCEESGGIDLIVIYNSGRYRMAGRGSLAGLMPFGNANEIVKEMAREVLTIIKETPVIAGVCGVDPFMLRDYFLKELIDLGFAGIQNFPTVGLIDGTFRANLEETGMGFGLEIDCIAAAHRLGLLTTPYVFDPEQAVAMTEAGADVLVAHMGLTTGGAIGAETASSLDDCVSRVAAIAAAGRSVRQDVIVLCHGGPIAMPNDAQYVLSRCDIHGFYGASSMERLPTETAIKKQVAEFTKLTLPK